MKMCSSIEKIGVKDIIESINNLSKLDKKHIPVASYMSWSQFLSIFPKIYDLVYFDGQNWYWDGGIKIHLNYNGIIPDNSIIFN